MKVADLSGTDLGEHDITYDEDDAILHALAIGAGEGDLSLVYERDLRALPSMQFGFGLWAVERTGSLGAYDPTLSLHVSQELAVHQPLPPAGRISMRGQVQSVWDKGTAAMIEIEVTSEYATASYGIFVPGAGGFGGDRGPSLGKPDHSTTPVGSATYHTTRQQAALYRLTGDRHPVHIDPVVASAAGFERPILHGLCTLGISVRQAANILRIHPADLRHVSARFTSPVLPGDALTTSVWRTGDQQTFGTRVGDREVVVGTSLVFS